MEDYEKKYKEALERAKQLKKCGACDMLECIDKIFPELRESEDEKIRKWLICYFKEVCDNVSEKEKKGIIAWLEKQGEQKPAIFIPKFRVGDKLVSTKNPRLTYEVLEVGHINELGNPEYKVEIFTDGKVSNPRNIHDMECYKVDEWAKLIEQKPVGFNIGDEITVNGRVCRVVAVDKSSWSKEDEIALGDALWCCEQAASISKDENDMGNAWYAEHWLKSLKYRVQPQPKQEWSEEDEVKINRIVACLENLNVADNDILLKDVDWLKSLRPQPKQDWSQNDIDMIDWLIRCCEKEHDELCNDKYGHQDIVSDLKRDCRKKWDWLESLKNRVAPQNTWKPSDEQMNALSVAVKHGQTDDPDSLKELLEQLKKLSEK